MRVAPSIWTSDLPSALLRASIRMASGSLPSRPAYASRIDHRLPDLRHAALQCSVAHQQVKRLAQLGQRIEQGESEKDHRRHTPTRRQATVAQGVGGGKQAADHAGDGEIA